MSELTLLISMPAGAEWILILLGLAMGFFWIKTIVEIATGTFKDNTTKIVWLLIVLITGVLGALIYTFVGRQSRIAA